jgi:RNA polymerase-interacting CarD/CdnL/TRCF family regulator
MLFEIDEQVVCSSYGAGRIAALVMKRFLEDEAHLYYEIVIGKSTVWLLADATCTVKELRPVTPKATLAHYRDVLRSCPIPLTKDSHQRQLDILLAVSKWLIHSAGLQWVSSVRRGRPGTAPKARRRPG